MHWVAMRDMFRAGARYYSFGRGESAGEPLQRPILPASRVVSSASDRGDRAASLPHLAHGTTRLGRDRTRIAMAGPYCISS